MKKYTLLVTELTTSNRLWTQHIKFDEEPTLEKLQDYLRTVRSSFKRNEFKLTDYRLSIKHKEYGIYRQYDIIELDLKNMIPDTMKEVR